MGKANIACQMLSACQDLPFLIRMSYRLLPTFPQTLKYLGENFNIPILVTNQVGQTACIAPPVV